MQVTLVEALSQMKGSVEEGIDHWHSSVYENAKLMALCQA